MFSLYFVLPYTFSIFSSGSGWFVIAVCGPLSVQGTTGCRYFVNWWCRSAISNEKSIKWVPSFLFLFYYFFLKLITTCILRHLCDGRWSFQYIYDCMAYGLHGQEDQGIQEDQQDQTDSCHKTLNRNDEVVETVEVKCWHLSLRCCRPEVTIPSDRLAGGDRNGSLHRF